MSINPQLKIIADHLRSSCFLIADGVLPSNEGRGYVLRRIMRRAMLQSYKLGKKQPIMHLLVDTLITEMGEAYPELIRAKATIIDTLFFEEQKFLETLEKGIKILDEAPINNQQLSGEIAFKLYDTYGFPLDLTQKICHEKNLTVNVKEFELAMQQQKERARNNWVGSGEVAEDDFFFTLKQQFGDTQHCYHQATMSAGKILAIIVDNKLLASIDSHLFSSVSTAFVVLDKTPFYATSGGQKGDDGNIIMSTDYHPNLHYQSLVNCLDIGETKKVAGGLFLHPITDCRGKFCVGDNIISLVNQRNRQLRAQNHSATHLLHKALKQVLGSAITQKGSNVDAKQFTFDFNFNRAMTASEIDLVEELINFYIRQNSPVNTKTMHIDEAKNSGAEALFGEKYDAMVRVVAMGPSQELCGGTHVLSTGNIGLIKIITENGVAAGIRRITAKSGFYALQHLKMQEQKLNHLLASLKIKQQFDDIKSNNSEFLAKQIGFDESSFFSNENQQQIISAEQQKSMLQVLGDTAKIGLDIQQQLKQKDKQILNLKQQIWKQQINTINKINQNNICLAYHIFSDADANDLRNILKIWQDHNKIPYLIAFFGEQGDKVNILVAVNGLDFDAGSIVAKLVDLLGGKGGGGKKDIAMGAGNNINNINKAIDYLQKLL